MKAHWKIHRLLLAVVAVGVLAAIVANPALARTSGVSQQMKVKVHKKLHRLARGAAAVGVSETAAASSALAAVVPAVKQKPPENESSGACPKSPTGYLEAENVGASFKNKDSETTYTFSSLIPEVVEGTGVPGLVKYCVYPQDQSSAPTGIVTVAEGENGELWLSRKSKNSANFSFVRPGGNKSNIPLDGKDHEMGTATWDEEAPPAEQTILLHINDPGVCEGLYGAGTSLTCFVLPKAGPICDQGAGNTEAAYNSMPTDFPPACFPPPAEAFQAQQVSEYGDDVTLGMGGEITSMIVDFQSYACEAGNWYDESCKSPLEGSWEFPAGHVITASIYLASDPTTPVAQATASPPIPFRPSWNEEKCTNPGTDANGGNDIGKWFNEANGYCVYSISDPIEFTSFTGTQTSFATGEMVIWTVAFDTSTWGYNPIGSVSGWDSLNVGDYTYENAPYAGLNPTPDKIWLAQNTTEKGNLAEGEIECPKCGPGGTDLFTEDLLPLARINTSGP